MTRLHTTFTSQTPLIMHSARSVNPLDPLNRKLKEQTKVKSKTDETLKLISDLEWELSLYWKEGIGFYIPAENIEKSIIEGARASRKGKDVEKFVTVEEMFCPLKLPSNPTMEKIKNDYSYRDIRSMVVSKRRIMRTRALFENWETSFTLRFDDSKMNIEDIVSALDYAGKYIGICDSRPKYGQYAVKIKEIT